MEAKQRRRSWETDRQRALVWQGPSSGDSSVEVEDARNGVRFKQPYYAADGSGATVAKSAEELEWEKRYKWLFIEDEQRSVLSRSPENIKDNAEKVGETHGASALPVASAGVSGPPY